MLCLYPPPPPGVQHGQADLGGVHRVLGTAVREQRAGHLPRGHAGVRQQDGQEPQAGQVPSWRRQTHLTHAQ